MAITAHCLVKNEEKFITYAVRSVIDFIDQILIFDTGSSDTTVAKIEALMKEYPSKIYFEEKGICDKKRHTELRQEMVEKTTTDWFMVLDGDEVWTRRAIAEAAELTKRTDIDCLIAPFYLAVGDIYHYSWRGQFTINDKKIHATARFFKKHTGIRWKGQYGEDCLFINGKNCIDISRKQILQHKFWHLTHLERSSIGSDYSSGQSRDLKRVPTYFLLGKKITEPVPEVFEGQPKLGSARSFILFLGHCVRKMQQKLYY